MDKIPVGILHSLTGPMAISETHLVDAALLAIGEINRDGGIMGHEIQPIVEDGSSHPLTFAARAEKLILEDHVAAIFGCWTSASRKAVKSVVEQYNALLFYPVQYEGLEQSRNIIYAGSCLNQQIEPAIQWCLSQNARSFFLIGSDYVFPKAANKLITNMIETQGGTICGEMYLPLCSDDASLAVRAIEDAKPDFVFNSINGSSNIAFFKEYDANDAMHPIMSFSFSELELQRVADCAAGHYSCWSYFQSLPTPENQRFIQNYQKRMGNDRVLSDPLVMAYSQIHLWRTCVEHAKTFDVDEIRNSMSEREYLSPAGRLQIQSNNHLIKNVFIGKAQNNGQFDIVWRSEKPVAPYPWLGVENTDLKSKSLIINVLSQYTEYENLSAALKESETKYRRLVEDITDEYMLFSSTPDHTITYVNSSVQQILGLDQNEFIGMNWKDLDIDEESLTQLEQERRNLLSKRQKVTFEIQIRCPNGEIRTLELYEHLVCSDKSQFITFEGIARDITTRKQAEYTQRLHSAIMDNVAEGIYIIGMDDLIIKWTNVRFAKMFGYSIGELEGKPVDVVNAPTEKTPSETRQTIVDILNKNGEWHGEIKNIKKNGEQFWCYANVSLFNHPEFGKVIVSVHTDITARKKAEEEREILIQKLEKALSEIKMLEGILPVCSYCKKIRNEQGDWEQVEKYISNHSEAEFSHGICPECAKKRFPQYYS